MSGWMMRFDLRVPNFAAGTHRDRYAAALEMAAWADERGCERILLSEHHGAEDGYLPSPTVMAAAIAARTSRVRIVIGALILPLHDPLRAAEQVLVLDQISGGRVEVIVGLGYVAREFRMFGLDPKKRRRLLEEKLPLFAAALTGAEVEAHGEGVRVGPPAVQRPRPPVFVGSGVEEGARRAARWGDGFNPMRADPELRAAYEEECRRLGKAPGPVLWPEGPMFLHVSREPDRDWEAIAPHALYEMNAYGRWATDAGADTGYTPMDDAAALRASGLYAVITPQDCVALARSMSPDATLALHPLMGGLAPDLAWKSLELFAAEVLPAQT